MTDEYKQWLDSLKVGDKVTYNCTKYGITRSSLNTISKITPKRSFVLDDDTRFNSKGIYKMEDYYFIHLEKVTPEIEEEILRNKIIYKIKSTDLYKIDIDKLKDINKIITGV